MRRLFALALILAVVFAGGIGYLAGTRDLLAPGPVAATGAACVTFPETGKQVCDRFLEYWQQNGGLAQQGLPLSNEFQEVSAVDGKTYTVQYFERAVFEKHPENARPYDVLLTLLGREKYQAKYPGGLPTSGTPIAPGQTAILPGSSTGVTFRVEIVGVETRSEVPAAYGQPGTQRAQGKFICVLARTTNLGQQPSSVDWIDLQVRDSKGRHFDLAEIVVQRGAEAVYGRKIPTEQIQPSFTVDMVFVFDVATDSENLVFEIDD